MRELAHGKTPSRSNSKLKRWLMRNSIVRQWISEAAYLKESLRSTGGHLTLPERHVAYIRVPKAASTSLCRTVLQSRFPELATRQLSPEQINLLADVHLDRKETSPQVIHFTVVRNPFERLVAVYREFFEGGHKPFIYEDYMFGIFRQDFSFRQFLETARLIPDALKDQHVKPQYQFLKWYESNGINVKVMMLEQPETIDAFLRGYGLTFEVFNQSQTAYDYRQYYDAETLAMAHSMYEQDVAKFGYGSIVEELQFMIEHGHVRN